MTQSEINMVEAQIGRIVHFVIDDNGRPQCRPAIVVHDWPDQGKPGYVNLVVFLDGSNDKGFANIIDWQTSIFPNHAVRAHDTWHWPRECQDLHLPQASVYFNDGNVVHHNHIDGVVDIRNCIACMHVMSRTQQ